MTGTLQNVIKAGAVTYITLEIDGDISEQCDRFKGCDLDISIEPHTDEPKRSLNANSYMWVLCTRIAQELSKEGTRHTKAEIYRKAVQEVGVYRDFVLKQDEAPTLRKAWEMLGTGWLTEKVDFAANGDDLLIRCYYGSSKYNKKQMKRLIDYIVQDCEALNIPHLTPEEEANLISLWESEGKKNG